MSPVTINFNSLVNSLSYSSSPTLAEILYKNIVNFADSVIDAKTQLFVS